MALQIHRYVLLLLPILLESVKMPDKCNLCPRKCGVNRSMGEKGVCQSTDEIKIARAALHFWEEPCISGEQGSGAVFFSGCQLLCVYCQNKKISRGETGKTVTVKRLAEIFLELQKKNAANINLVSGDHYIFEIIEAVKISRKMGLFLPIVYNCSGYETAESIKELNGTVDIYLPDFKYISCEASRKYSKAPDYPEVAKTAIAEMVRQQKEAVFDETGLMKNGVIVRHLVLPPLVEDAKKIIKYLYNTYGDSIYISIMNQYTPLEWVKDIPELSKVLSEKAYNGVVDYAIALGVENAYIQEGKTAGESFIPEFDCEGV